MARNKKLKQEPIEGETLKQELKSDTLSLTDCFFSHLVLFKELFHHYMIIHYAQYLWCILSHDCPDICIHCWQMW